MVPEVEIQKTEPPKELMTQSDPAEEQSLMLFRQSLKDKNRNFFIKKILLNPFYCRFIDNIVRDFSSNFLTTLDVSIQRPPQETFIIFKFAITAFLTTILRLSDKTFSYNFLKSLSTVIAQVNFQSSTS